METTPIVINPLTEEESAKAQEITSAVVAGAEALVIKTRDDMNKGADALSKLKSQYKTFETQRQEMKKPILVAGKNVDNFFKPYLNELSKAESIIKQTMLTAKNKFDSEDAEREAKIMARVEKEGRGRLTEETGINKISEIDRVDKKLATNTGGFASFKKIKQVTVTDMNLIPKKYLLPESAEDLPEFKPWPNIRSAAIKLYELQQAGHEISQIPGIEVREIESIASR